MGFRATAEEGNHFRFEAGQDGAGTVVHLRRVPGFWRGSDGVGTVHHVAFRAADDAEQKARQDELRGLGVSVTDVRDRNYFRSIYFREPGGVLFEIATDGPGFTIDESRAELGTTLTLPPQYESMRPRLERALPPLRLPHGEAMEA
jgi:glyoxalase family protein